jgi:trehalose-6-phosphate synthase
MFPAWRGKVVLIQVALATTETNEAQENISDLVTRINSRFSSLTYQPVVLLHTEPPTFSQYLGLMTAADAFINTSLREGMNLTSHEFIRCRTSLSFVGRSPRLCLAAAAHPRLPLVRVTRAAEEGKHGAMILSEFTGSYSHSSFQSCLPVNPVSARPPS